MHILLLLGLKVRVQKILVPFRDAGLQKQHVKLIHISTILIWFCTDVKPHCLLTFFWGRKQGDSPVKCWGQSRETWLRLFGNRKREKLKQLILLCSIANRALKSWERLVGMGEGRRAAFHKADSAAMFQQMVSTSTACWSAVSLAP